MPAVKLPRKCLSSCDLEDTRNSRTSFAGSEWVRLGKLYFAQYLALSARGQSLEGECASKQQGSGFRLLLRERGIVGKKAWI